MVVSYTPRNPDTVRKQIEDTKQLIKLHLNLLKKFPEDRALKLSLEQYLHRTSLAVGSPVFQNGEETAKT